jgi:hypothetical protein
MASQVRFYLGTREQYNNIVEKNPLALYFCEDTAELFRGDQCISDGVRIVPTKADLPECSCAADGIVYFIAETKSGFMVSPDRTEWLQTIYAPVTDAYVIPEEEMYTTVTTVGAVRDIETAIYKYIDEEVANISGLEDTSTFGNVVTSVSCGGIEAGTSLQGKTMKDVLTMLLGIKEAPQSAVDYITENNIPFYSGLQGGESSEVVYQQLDTATAKYTDQGFYTTTNDKGEVTNAGYQVTFEENTESIAQTFALCETAKIVTAYQYQPALDQWLDMGFDGTYWVENGTITEIINGQEVVYTTYIYNTELMGDAITSPEYWRFEVEVI